MLSTEQNIGRFLTRGGSRTSPRRGRQSLGGAYLIFLIIFSEKPYEIKEILVRRARVDLARERDPSSRSEFGRISTI